MSEWQYKLIIFKCELSFLWIISKLFPDRLVKKSFFLLIYFCFLISSTPQDSHRLCFKKTGTGPQVDIPS